MNPCPNIRGMWTNWDEDLTMMRVSEVAGRMESFRQQWFWRPYLFWVHGNGRP
jgi:hypothetical protein